MSTCLCTLARWENKYWKCVLSRGLDLLFCNFFWRSKFLRHCSFKQNQCEPVWAETVNNYPALKLELLSPQNRYICHQGGVWKINGTPIFVYRKGLLVQNINFWKFLVIQHYTCWIYLDLDLNLVFFIMQNYPVRGEWNEADCLETLLIFRFKVKVVTLMFLPLIAQNCPIVPIFPHVLRQQIMYQWSLSKIKKMSATLVLNWHFVNTK